MSRRKRNASPKAAPGPRWSARLLRGALWGVALSVSGGAVYWLMETLLDPRTLPIKHVEVTGDLRNLDAQRLRSAVRPYAEGGFFTVDIAAIRRTLGKQPWVDQVRVRRLWPHTVRVEVVEHQALARWGKRGLVNTRGEWFDAPDEDVPADLPVLEGPPGYAPTAARRYVKLAQTLRAAGLGIKRLRVTARRAWELQLDNGAVLKLGRDAVEVRLARFVRVYPSVLAPRIDRISAVDLRYPHGLAVTWKREARDTTRAPQAQTQQSAS